MGYKSITGGEDLDTWSKGAYAFALGEESVAGSSHSVAIGRSKVDSNSPYAVAIGKAMVENGDYSLAIGEGKALNKYAFAAG